ncbi:hypothetical protein PRUPE_1G273500 [Prunus persica]|uniref:Uncharacterized protein n=1 Tax=Prunus persica TaxID=3760 RepID=A0A251R451_PRUPE|nr:hypothetical protein PRUPE_1G273500 [Prunus persica]
MHKVRGPRLKEAKQVQNVTGIELNELNIIKVNPCLLKQPDNQLNTSVYVLSPSTVLFSFYIIYKKL